MYCIQCGIKLADTEKTCPLCSPASAALPKEVLAKPLYPKNRYPERSLNKGAINGALLFLFATPLLIAFIAALQIDNGLNLFWYTAGAITLAYCLVALPVWFSKPNPVIFVPCDFAAVGLYLLLIQYLTNGNWFLSFAFPVTGGLCLIVTTVVTLLRYLRGGRLYIFGGAFIALGGLLLFTEFMLSFTFGTRFSGWSIYPLVALCSLGGLLIFLAINSAAREKMERRFFF